MNQEQIWNKIAADWSKYRQKPVEEVVEFLKGKKGKVLDLGCGSGRNIIKQEGLEFYGVDFSSEMLKLAEKSCREKSIKARFTKSELDKLPFDDEYFDTGVFISTLHCIENETRRRKTLLELARVLKSGAEAIISVWDKNSDSEFSKIESKESFVNWKKDGVNLKRYYYFYDVDELEYLLKDVGFDVLKISSNESSVGHSHRNILIFVRKT
jgi:ubiquinone/menaquinone biosynthesis C-methylase UbiE